MARFIKEGLQVNDTVIIVATAQHCEELRKALTPEQVTHDKLMFLDAGEQLWKFMVNDWSSELRFRNVVGGMMGQARLNGPVRILVKWWPSLGRRVHPRRPSSGRTLEQVSDGTTFCSLVCLSLVEVFRGQRQRFDPRHFPIACARAYSIAHQPPTEAFEGVEDLRSLQRRKSSRPKRQQRRATTEGT